MELEQTVRRFVQTTLGCRCPEEVFRSIDLARNVPVNNFITLSVRAVVGERLLIYVAEAGSAGCVQEHLPVLLTAGRKERDDKGLNRFGLVLVSDDPDLVRMSAERLFDELRDEDDKLHLHVIRKAELDFATEISEDTER